MAEMEPAGPAERRRQSKAEKRGHDLDWAHYEVGLTAYLAGRTAVKRGPLTSGASSFVLCRLHSGAPASGPTRTTCTACARSRCGPRRRQTGWPLRGIVLSNASSPVALGSLVTTAGRGQPRRARSRAERVVGLAGGVPHPRRGRRGAGGRLPAAGVRARAPLPIPTDRCDRERTGMARARCRPSSDASHRGFLFARGATGVRWLWELHGQKAGGIIGDEMVRTAAKELA